MSAQLAAQTQMQMATVCTGDAALSAQSVIFNPRYVWRGFFVGYSFYFSFLGYRQMPARAGATKMPE